MGAHASSLSNLDEVEQRVRYSDVIPGWEHAARSLRRDDLPWQLREEAAGATDEHARRLLVEQVVDEEHGLQAVHIAAVYGRLKSLQLLVEELHAHVDAVTKDGSTPALLAARFGQLPALKYLLEVCHATPTVRTVTDTSMVSEAAKNGHLDVVKYLVSHRHADHDDGVAALLAACHGGHETVVQYLIADARIAVNSIDKHHTSALHAACLGNHPNIVQLIGRGMDAESLNMRMANGETALAIAARHGAADTVALLLNTLHVAVDVADEHGATALFHACAGGHDEVVQLLLAAGANATSANAKHVTPLQTAVVHGHAKVVERLLQAGRATLTPELLPLAADHAHLPIVQLLVQSCGVNVNSQNTQGETALFRACQHGNHAIVDYLLGCSGVQVDMATHSGTTALIVACANGQVDVVARLLEGGADPNLMIPKLHVTPIHVASAYGHAEIVKLLLARHASTDVTASGSFLDVAAGETPLATATANGHSAVVEVLSHKK